MQSNLGFCRVWGSGSFCQREVPRDPKGSLGTITKEDLKVTAGII